MSNNNKKSQIKISKETPCLSFKELHNYFRDPDLKIQNLYAISAQQFTKDLDSMIDFSKKKLGLYGKIDSFLITVASNSTEKGIRPHWINSVQKREKFKLYRILNKLFNNESHSITKIKIKSWKFTDFDDTEKFQVGKLYTIKPVRVTYNSTQQDYKYSKQIISEFCIEEANGKIKKLIIIDNIKNGTIRREKYIDGQKINRQHYNLEIRNHDLNRGLMKTFLFHKISKYKTFEYDQDSGFWNNKTDLKFVVAQPIINEPCQTKETEFSTQKTAGKFPEEYIKMSVFKAPTQNQKKAIDTNNVYNLQNEYDNDAVADDRAQVQEIIRIEADSIYVADDYNDLENGNRFIFP